MWTACWPGGPPLTFTVIIICPPCIMNSAIPARLLPLLASMRDDPLPAGIVCVAAPGFFSPSARAAPAARRTAAPRARIPIFFIATPPINEPQGNLPHLPAGGKSAVGREGRAFTRGFFGGQAPGIGGDFDL